MKSAVIVLMFAAAIADTALLVFVLIELLPVWDFAVAHILLYLLINRLENKFLDNGLGVPGYFALFLPGLGPLLVSMLYGSLYFLIKDGLILKDYEMYINFDRYLEHNEKLDYEKEMKTMSFLDQMNLLDAASKKNLIVNYTINREEGKVGLLLKGLQDQDEEVKHYSAVTLNMLENEYTHLINRTREEYNANKDIDSLKRLAGIYKAYIESGLISGEVLQFFNREYIETLKKLTERRKRIPENTAELIKAYIRAGNLEAAFELNNEFLEQYPERPEALYYKMNIAYEKKDFRTLRSMAKNAAQKQEHELQEMEGLLAFWTAQGETI